MGNFLTVPPDLMVLQLYDACSAFRAAFDKFEEDQTADNWEACLIAAQEFRAKVKRMDGGE